MSASVIRWLHVFYVVLILVSNPPSIVNSFHAPSRQQQLGVGPHHCRTATPAVLAAYSPNPQYRRDPSSGSRSSGSIDARSIKEGSLIEYVSGKGSKRLAIVNKRTGAHLEVLNDARKAFSVPISRVTHHINGSFAFGDLLRLTEMLGEMKPIQVERLWEAMFDQINPSVCNIATISKQIYGSTDPVRMFVSMKLMASFGNVFFDESMGSIESAAPATSSSSSTSSSTSSDTSSGSDGPPRKGEIGTLFVPLPPAVVQENLRNRAALKEFKLRFTKIMTNGVQRSASAPPVGSAAGRTVPGITSGTASSMYSNRDIVALPDMPDRIFDVLAPYAEGLKQIVVKGHPWLVSGWARRKYDEKVADKGRELLDFLELAPSVKNAKKVLEVIGVWPLHTNIEKFVMDLRDKFPPEVLDEAQYLLDNADVIPDPDERLRRDLRHLGCYAVDRYVR